MSGSSGAGLYHFFRRTFHAYFTLYNRIEVLGREFIPSGGFIAVSNHTSYLDPLVLGVAVGGRRMTYLAKKELFSIPLVGWFVGSFSVPVDRERTSHMLIKELVRRLSAGEAVAMFPAGGRDKEGDGSSTDFRRGLGLLAKLSKTRILPAYIAGTDGSLPVGGKFPKPSKISVRFAPCLEAGQTDAEQLVLLAMESIKVLKGKNKNWN